MAVTVEWFGCATFRVRVAGLTLFFDTYLDKVPGVDPVGLTAAEVDEASFLFVSHAHFDHVLGADTIAKATGATVVGNYETHRLMAANGVPDSQVIPTAGGDVVDCGAGVSVRSLPAQHACLYAAASPDSGGACLGDLGVDARSRRRREREILELVPTLSEPLTEWFTHAGPHTSTRDGGQLAYLMESPAGSLLVSASSGYWSGIFAGLRPDVAILAAAGRPNVDGEPYQGSLSDFLVEQVELLGRPRVVLCHHDPLLPPVVGATDVTDAERRLRELLGDGCYITVALAEPATVLA